jgi:hypothetical protein
MPLGSEDINPNLRRANEELRQEREVESATTRFLVAITSEAGIYVPIEEVQEVLMATLLEHFTGIQGLAITVDIADDAPMVH